MSGVAVVGAGVVSTAGAGRSALADALRASARLRSGEVPAAVEDLDPTPPHVRARVSRAAQLAAIAARGALAEAGWTGARADIGYFLGVGASGGHLAEIEALLAASLADGQISPRLLGERGLGACNPLLTFQSLHNFTLCHSAILEGTGGPNGAFFSRGGGTVLALGEAMHALAEGDCSRALAGGADTALHPVTLSELERGGWVARGLVPGEGAAVLALGSAAHPPLATIEQCRLYPARGSLGPALAAACADLAAPPSHLVLAPWGQPPRGALRALAGERFPAAQVLDLTEHVGECLAAGPALAWVAAIELCARAGARRVLVLSAGVDGDVGSVVVGSRGAP